MKKSFLKQAGLVIILTIITLYFNACTNYAYKDIQVLSPPTTNLFLKGKKVTILQNSYRKPADSTKRNLMDTIHRYTLEGFMYSLVDYGNIEYDVDTATRIRITKDNHINYYDWRKIDSIVKAQNSEIILIHDASDIDFKTDFMFSDDGYVEAWKDFYLANRWIILNPQDQTVIKEEITIDTLTYTEYGLFINPTKEKLPKLQDALAELSWETGRLFAEKYIPTWQNRTRLYFELPNDGYFKGITALKNNNFETAAAVFQKFSNHKNERVASLSKYNMAVVCELQGEYKIALEWLRNSYELKQYYSTEEYIKIIKRRITEEDYISQ